MAVKGIFPELQFLLREASSSLWKANPYPIPSLWYLLGADLTTGSEEWTCNIGPPVHSNKRTRMTSGTFAGIAKRAGCYTGSTTCHQREKTWLRMKLPRKEVKQKWKEVINRRSRREKERLQKYNLALASGHARELRELYTLGFSVCQTLEFFP